MIDTLFFILQIIGILVLIGWAVVHDRQAEGTPTRGPLAFKPDEDEKASGSSPSRGRKGRMGLKSRLGL